jgi:glycosyltransferase involved in cell wall biosynthesis
MKIVIDAREYPTSTGRYVRKLLEYLEKIDAESKRQYIVLIKSADFDSYQPKASNFTKIKSDFKEFTFSEQMGFLRHIRNLKPDLVHFSITQQPVLYSGKEVTTIHDLTTLRFTNPAKNLVIFKFKQLVYGWVIKKVAKKSDHIITISEYVKNDILQYTGINPTKITVTLEAADKVTANPEPFPNLSEGSYLLYVGRNQPHKNIRRFIDAFAILKKTRPELKLVLVGKKDALSEKHNAYAATQQINDVIFTGYVSEGQLRWLYENCACYVFPSLSEGFGLPPLEAMIHGAPVVSSNATCLPEINGDAAHYFDPLDTNDIAKKTAEVLDNNNLRQELIQKGAEQVKKYSWQRMAEQTLEIYKKVLSS